MSSAGRGLNELLAELSPEGRRALAEMWVRRALQAHVADALEAAGFVQFAEDLRGASPKDVTRVVQVGRQTERALDHRLSISSPTVGERRAYDALSEALAGAGSLERPTLPASELLACSEHVRRAEALTIAVLCGPKPSDRIVLAREPDRQAADARRLTTA